MYGTIIVGFVLLNVAIAVFGWTGYWQIEGVIFGIMAAGFAVFLYMQRDAN